MHHIKKLTLLLTFSLSIPLAGEESFRGKSLDELAGTSIPISFMNLVSNNYDILPSQINPQRGGYLIISPDGIAAYLDDFVDEIIKQNLGKPNSTLNLPPLLSKRPVIQV